MSSHVSVECIFSGWHILQDDVFYWKHVLLEDMFYLKVYLIGGHVLQVEMSYRSTYLT